MQEKLTILCIVMSKNENDRLLVAFALLVKESLIVSGKEPLSFLTNRKMQLVVLVLWFRRPEEGKCDLGYLLLVTFIKGNYVRWYF